MNNPYLDPQRVRAALRSLDLRPTRAMGQNFLLDPDVLAAIVAAAELEPHDRVIEVGPGLGVLTWELTQRVAHTVAVELDRRLAVRLRDEFAGAALTLVESDILRVSPERLVAAFPDQAEAAPAAYKLVANLPYAITSAVLRHFLEAPRAPALSVVLVQWEVAERIVAAPGALSVLAHSVQIYAEATIIQRVSAASFLPAPAVDSAILQLRRHAVPAVDLADRDGVFRVIKAGFLHARKQLGNALPGGLAAQGRPIDRNVVLAALEATGISPQRRAETLTLAEWVALYQVLDRTPSS